MTDHLRQQVARLRDLSPKLNRVTDEAARVVQAVEGFLNDECSIGIPCRVRFKEVDDQDRGFHEVSYLGYDRFQGKFRLLVTDVLIHDGNLERDETVAWASSPRDVKLASFQAIPKLLAELSDQVERAIEQTEGASRTINDLLRVIGGPRKEVK